jgi:hypothetical protein
MRVARLVSVLIAAALTFSLAACGTVELDGDSGASADGLESAVTTDSEESANASFEGLVFSDVGVYTTKSVGLTSLSVTVRGTVQNASTESVARSAFPELECNGTGYVADIGTQQLAPGESCAFVYSVECRVDEEHQSYEWSFSEGEGVLCQGLEGVPQLIDERVKARIAEMLEAKSAAESDEAKQNRQDAEEKHRATTCFVSWGGELYHENPTCPGLEGDRNLEEMTIGKAIDGGYAPCQLCTY